MSHESVLTDLKNLIKQRVIEFDPKTHIRHIMGESDRAYIILHAATAEDVLLAYLEEAMPGLNSEEKTGIFQFNGPAGSFSSRIWLAQGLGLLTRKERKQLEVIKAMRNTAAHAHGPLTFDTPEIRRAVASFFRPRDRADVESWEARELREIFGLFCTAAVRCIGDPERTVNVVGLYDLATESWAERRAWRDTHSEESSPESPQPDQK